MTADVLITFYIAVAISQWKTLYGVSKGKMVAAEWASLICGLLWPVFWFHQAVTAIHNFLMRNS